jgi:hypothetical protein
MCCFKFLPNFLAAVRPQAYGTYQLPSVAYHAFKDFATRETMVEIPIKRKRDFRYIPEPSVERM